MCCKLHWYRLPERAPPPPDNTPARNRTPRNSTPPPRAAGSTGPVKPPTHAGTSRQGHRHRCFAFCSGEQKVPVVMDGMAYYIFYRPQGFQVDGSPLPGPWMHVDESIPDAEDEDVELVGGDPLSDPQGGQGE